MEASPHWHLLADFSDQVRPHVDQTLQSVNTLIRQLAGHCSSDTLAATVVRVHSSLAAVHRVGVQHLQHSLRRLESLANALARLRSELKANDDRLQRLLGNLNRPNAEEEAVAARAQLSRLSERMQRHRWRQEQVLASAYRLQTRMAFLSQLRARAGAVDGRDPRRILAASVRRLILFLDIHTKGHVIYLASPHVAEALLNNYRRDIH